MLYGIIFYQKFRNCILNNHFDLIAAFAKKIVFHFATFKQKSLFSVFSCQLFLEIN